MAAPQFSVEQIGTTAVVVHSAPVVVGGKIIAASRADPFVLSVDEATGSYHYFGAKVSPTATPDNLCVVGSKIYAFSLGNSTPILKIDAAAETVSTFGPSTLHGWPFHFPALGEIHVPYRDFGSYPVTVINTSTDAVSTYWPAGARYFDFHAAAAGAIWSVNSATVLRINPSTRTLAASISLTGLGLSGFPTAMVVGPDGNIWVFGFTRVVKINTSTNSAAAVGGTITTAVSGAFATATAVYGVTSTAGAGIIEVDVSTGSVSTWGTVAATLNAPVAAIVGPDGAAYVAPNGGALRKGIDLATRTISDIPVIGSISWPSTVSTRFAAVASSATRMYAINQPTSAPLLRYTRPAPRRGGWSVGFLRF